MGSRPSIALTRRNDQEYILSFSDNRCYGHFLRFHHIQPFWALEPFLKEPAVQDSSVGSKPCVICNMIEEEEDQEKKKIHHHN
jgi:hypothetical protein